MEITGYLATRKALIDDALDGYLQPRSGLPATLLSAMRYSVFAGGKRFRPILALAASEAVGGDLEPVLPAACAIEMIHTFSLIHDDLPALDDAEHRRGKLTNHRVFGDAIALLAGDGLLLYPFELLSTVYGDGLATPAIALRLIREVASAAGIRGMVGGQLTDLESEGEEPDEETLRYVHMHKTGDMIAASARLGAIIGGANERQLAVLTAYARNLGLAFQIRDDTLDAIGDPKKLGKTVRKDREQEKATYVALYGLHQARNMAVEVAEKAKSVLVGLKGEREVLRLLADFVISRDR